MLEVKKLRCELGATQKQLSLASDLDIRWIQKVESGEINLENVTVKKFFQLSKGLSALAQGTPPGGNAQPIQNVYSTMRQIFVSESG